MKAGASQQTRIQYEPLSGERWLFAGARLDLCARKCHRPTVGLAVRLDTFRLPTATAATAATTTTITNSTTTADDFDAPQDSSKVHASAPVAAAGSAVGEPKTVFHCDRDSYAMVSKRRLCGK